MVWADRATRRRLCTRRRFIRRVGMGSAAPASFHAVANAIAPPARDPGRARFVCVIRSDLRGVANFQVIPLALGFVILALIAVAAIVLSLLYGPWFAALGLGAGYLAPILVHFQRPSTAALFGYILAITAAALAVIKLRQWKGFVWLASGGALAWALFWLSTPYGPRAFGDAALFVVGLAMLGMAFAWKDAGAPVPMRDIADRKPPWTESMFAAHVLFGASMLILQGLLQRSHDPTIVTAILALCVVSAVIASIREGFGLMPLGAGLLGISLVAGWPVRAYDAPTEISAMFRAAGALGFIFSGGGWLMMARNRSAGLGAALAALGPIGVVVAAHEAGGFLRVAILWTAPALALAVINAFALERLARRLGGVDRAPGASAAFALGAAGSLLFALYFLLEQHGFWLTGALAAMIPAMAWLDLRLKLPALRIPISVTAFVVLWRLVVMFEPLKVSPTPIFNELLPGFGLAAIALYLAARFYRHAATAPRLVDTLEAGRIDRIRRRHFLGSAAHRDRRQSVGAGRHTGGGRRLFNCLAVFGAWPCRALWRHAAPRAVFRRSFVCRNRCGFRSLVWLSHSQSVVG